MEVRDLISESLLVPTAHRHETVPHSSLSVNSRSMRYITSNHCVGYCTSVRDAYIRNPATGVLLRWWERWSVACDGTGGGEGVATLDALEADIEQWTPAEDLA